ncbi:MAG: hypothetical protein GY906_17960 [bacterium]|nr:hypothetical protein [bacterium]
MKLSKYAEYLEDALPWGWWLCEVSRRTGYDKLDGHYAYARNDTHYVELCIPGDKLESAAESEDVVRRIIKEEIEIAVENVVDPPPITEKEGE